MAILCLSSIAISRFFGVPPTNAEKDDQFHMGAGTGKIVNTCHNSASYRAPDMLASGK